METHLASEAGAELFAEGASNAAATISAVERLSPVETIARPDDDRPLVFFAPKGKKIIDAKPYLDALLARPERRTGTARLLDLSSFIDHTMRFQDPERSALFAVRDPHEPKLISVLDYHDKGAASDASFCAHRGEYAFPLSEEWRRWIGQNRAQMNQATFAEFIETNVLDLLPAEAAGESAKDFASKLGVEFAGPQRMIEVSRGLSAHVKDTLHQAVNIGSGEVSFSFTSTHENAQGQPLKVPSAFLVGLPVFKRGDVFQLAARLRYRVKEGNVTWWYELLRVDVVFDTAVEEAAKKAQESTGLPLFFGTPES